jgi:5-methyltetrahydrofolate--homocysteine methyltransferase
VVIEVTDKLYAQGHSEFDFDASPEYVAETQYFGDALPYVLPEPGLNFFSSMLDVSELKTTGSVWSGTSFDWGDMRKLRFSADDKYTAKAIEAAELLLKTGKGKFFTGFPCVYGGGDAAAFLLGASRLGMEVFDSPDSVKELLEKLNSVYFDFFNVYSQALSASGQPCAQWPGIISSLKWTIISNDFSCLLSPGMFEEIFLSSIARDCDRYPYSVYHLDGPDCLKHLAPVLSLKNLTAVQWVPGIGNGPASRWMNVYKKCLGAGKCVQIFLSKKELDIFMESLRPEGVWLKITDAENAEEAEFLLKKVSNWR